jgi:hypothetical protein
VVSRESLNNFDLGSKIIRLIHLKKLLRQEQCEETIREAKASDR